MITLKDFMETVDYRITEGSSYCWDCFGPNAYQLDTWNGDHNGHSISVVFDTKYQTVYQIAAHDYKNNRSYRWTHPDSRDEYQTEVKNRDIDDVAWDNVNYIDLDISDDFLVKARAIVLGEDYDTRIDVPLILPNDQLFELMKLAHQRDLTLNQLVEDILTKIIDTHETDNIDRLKNKRKKKNK
jgi:hypothetical protein